MRIIVEDEDPLRAASAALAVHSYLASLNVADFQVISRTPRGAAAARDLWVGLLTIDASVSEADPVVAGTRVTVGQVVSDIVDGLSWDQVTERRGITEDHVRAALVYYLESEGVTPGV